MKGHFQNVRNMAVSRKISGNYHLALLIKGKVLTIKKVYVEDIESTVHSICRINIIWETNGANSQKTKVKIDIPDSDTNEVDSYFKSLLRRLYSDTM